VSAAAKDVYSSVRSVAAKDAVVIASAVNAIERDKGRLDTQEMAEELVARSRSAGSPTHHLFEWDDRKAARAQRIDRAKELIASVLITFESAAGPVRAFPVVISEGKRGPMPMRRVLETPDLLEALLEQAMADIETFRRRYERLRALRPVLAAMTAYAAKAKKRKGSRDGRAHASP
jgi:hypothetical protein